MSLYYRAMPLQYDFNRFNADGGKLEFIISSPRNGGPKVFHKNFENPPNVLWNVRKVSGRDFIEENAYGEKTYITFVGLKDGVLVIDISMNGRIGEAASFRSVMIAVPAAFKWSPGE
ncbi:MAG: hypothetical protein JNM27_14365 [Leptospirales bacterium]|nr:hypothetical protein [Leptospirales bacterium]